MTGPGVMSSSPALDPPLHSTMRASLWLTVFQVMVCFLNLIIERDDESDVPGHVGKKAETWSATVTTISAHSVCGKRYQPAMPFHFLL